MGEGVTSMLLVNVLSGTEYSVKVMASYSGGSSEPLVGRAKTRESDLPRPQQRPRLLSSSFSVFLCVQWSWGWAG